MLGAQTMAAKDEKSTRGNDEEALRKEVTKNVRGLLLSVQNGLTVAEIQRDYKCMIGKPFPFRELGHNTPLDLLKDLSDVARPSWENGVLVLRGECCWTILAFCFSTPSSKVTFMCCNIPS